MKQGKIKAVLSDGGNILFSDVGMKRGPYNKISPYIPELTYDEFKTGYRKFKTLSQTLPNYGNNDALRDYLIEIGHPEVFDRIQSGKKEKRAIEVNPGVKETLQALHENKLLFIVLTDATKRGEHLKPYLTHLGIDEYVTDIISSKDVGVTKPDEKFFNTVLEKYGLKKEDVIFVAHDDDELIGAQTLGIKVYALNYDSNQDLSYLDESQKLQNIGELETIVLGH